MPLYVVSTPIGNADDMGKRALKHLQDCDVLIGEDRKPTYRMLSQYGIKKETVRLLNEHSSPDEVEELSELCRDQHVALVSDSGCPGFCDPGYALVARCRKKKIAITAIPGASSLSVLLALSGRKITQFDFAGFPPRDSNERSRYLKTLPQKKQPTLLMDTPYRLRKLLSELSEIMPDRVGLLGCNLTMEDEYVFEGPLNKMVSECPFKKAEFMLLIYTS